MKAQDTFEELRKILLEEERAEIRRYKTYFLQPDPDRSLLLTAHIVVESVLTSMISTQLRHPECWLPEADFRSKVNLARALGLIGPRQLTVCRVLNTARNEMAHSLQPLAPKWRTELERLAYGGSRRRSKKKSPRFDETLRELFAIVGGPWMHAKFHKKMGDLTVEHGERWLELMKAKIKEHILAGDYDDSPGNHKLAYEVSLEVLRELQQKKT